MTTPHDPAAMSPADRLTELAVVLANAYLRLLESGDKELEESRQVEAPCRQTVNAIEITGKETA